MPDLSDDPMPKDDIKISLKMKPQDCWVGVFWEKRELFPWHYHHRWRWDVWICLVPMLPIHIQWTRTEREAAHGN